MLLNFKCDNFKSFRNGFDFNMTPEKRMSELAYSTLSEKAGRNTEKVLSASVIYGPNAGGKTSIVNAMSVMRQIVLRGTVRDDAGPVSFDVMFTSDGVKYRFILAVFTGAFLEQNAERYVAREQLYVNDELVFSRVKDAAEKLFLKPIQEYLNVGFFISDTEKIRKAMSGNITKDSLLLTTDFNSFCSKKLVGAITAWFADRFIIVNSSDRMRFYPDLMKNNGKAMIDVYINRVAQEAGIIGSGFAYVSALKTHTAKLMTVLQKTGERLYGLDADRIESVGTMRLISIMLAIISAMQKGAALKSLDEFKRAEGFQKILNEYVTLDSVFDALKRAEKIVRNNEAQGKKLEMYKGFRFYQENPDISVHESVRMIFEVCKIQE